jgi:hypothetical protein
LPTRFQKRFRIVLPSCLVKISRQKEAGFIQEHWVHAHDEITAIVILTAEMPTNYIVRNGQELSVRAFGTFDSGLFTDALNPLVGANWRITGFAGLAALESTRVNVVAASKKRAEESDLRFWG